MYNFNCYVRLTEEYIVQWHLMNVEPEIFLASIFLKLRFGFQYENWAFGGLTNCTSQIPAEPTFFHQKENIERERVRVFRGMNIMDCSIGFPNTKKMSHKTTG